VLSFTDCILNHEELGWENCCGGVVALDDVTVGSLTLSHDVAVDAQGFLSA